MARKAPALRRAVTGEEMTFVEKINSESSRGQKLQSWIRGRSSSRANWVFFAAAIFVALFVAMSNVGGFGLATHAAIPLSTHAEEARRAFGGTDAGSYLQAALGLRDLGPQGVVGNQWIYNLWPPGMVALNLILVTLEEITQIPYVALLVFVSALVWTLFLSRIFWFFQARKAGVGFLFLATLMLSSLGSPMLSDYIGYADGFAAGFLVMAVVELFRQGPLPRNLLSAVYLRAVIFLSLAMHFRTTYETLATFLVVVPAALTLLWFALSNLWPQRFIFSWRNPVTSVFFVALGSQLLSIPWRLIAGRFVRPGDYRWTTVLDTAPSARWFPTNLYSEEAGFLRVGHANFGCLNDPVRCEEIRVIEQTSSAPYTGSGNFSQEQFHEELIQSFLNHPFTYFLERTSMFFHGFFSTTGGSVGDLRIFEGLFILGGFFVAMIFLARNREAGLGGLVMAFLSIGALSGVLLFFHMETRYMFPIKFLMMVIIFLALSQRRKDTTVP